MDEKDPIHDDYRIDKTLSPMINVTLPHGDYDHPQCDWFWLKILKKEE